MSSTWFEERKGSSRHDDSGTEVAVSRNQAGQDSGSDSVSPTCGVRGFANFLELIYAAMQVIVGGVKLR